ncbi:MAG: LodA/GoxA family CTQ-dependent oxidase [bacterium]
MSGDVKGPPAEAGGHGDEPINIRAPFTRRSFLVGAGAAVAVAGLGGRARAAGPAGPDPIYRIHPAIGVARVGNADPASFFIGPEVPGFGPLGEAPGTAVPAYKTPDGRIKPQGARFRIFEYASVNGQLTPVREVTLATPGVVSIRWSVHLANKKASFFGFEGGQGEDRPPAARRNAAVADRRSLEIDFGGRSISGASQGPVQFRPTGGAGESVPLGANGQPVIDYLGQLRTDAAGRLIVLGGQGKSGYNTPTQPEMPHWANNDGWFDDASDGPVTATVTIDVGGQLREISMDPAGEGWVLCGPPDFAPGVPGSVTAYDLLLDMAVRHLDLPADNALYAPGGALARLAALKADFQEGGDPELPTYRPDFAAEIEPMLVAAYNLWWIDGLVNAKHNTLISPKLADPGPAAASARERVFSYMRAPLGAAAGQGSRTMPKILGDDPYIGQMPDAVKRLTITPTQFALLRRWAAGAFDAPAVPPADPVITPHGLDRAALENCVGGAFFPGIEFGWQMRNPALFAEPFRLDHGAFSAYLGDDEAPIGPGHFSRQMAVPWQADFNDCRNEGNYAWWPAQRPTHVLPSTRDTRRVDWARPDRRFEGGNRESTHEDMVRHWYKFGFVLEEGDMFIEKERAASIP